MSLTDLAWLDEPVPAPDWNQAERARLRQAHLNKPVGSLGRLEELAVMFCAWQGVDRPWLGRLRVVVFGADHGISREGVSALPALSSAEMIRNAAGGDAAISILSRDLGAELELINLGTVEPMETNDLVLDQRIAPGTRNFAEEPAMSRDELAEALNAGHEAVQRGSDVHLLIAGEMGVGGTSAATAVACALLGESPDSLCGPGSGLDEEGVGRKAALIRQALTRHPDRAPLEILRCLGGFELAALTGTYLACGQAGLPVLVDGFVGSVAALAAVTLQPELKQWLMFSHQSSEPGHGRVLAALEAEPLLNLGLSLGEGSGAALAVPLLRMACNLHDNMREA